MNRTGRGLYLAQKEWNEKGWRSGPGCLFAVTCVLILFGGLVLLGSGEYFWGAIFTIASGWSLCAGIRNQRKRRK